MSGRSAYVRKLNTKTKDGQHSHERKDLSDLHRGEIVPEPVSRSTRSIASSSSDERNTRVKQRSGDVSNIEKSSFRSLMDKRSEGVRKGLLKTFGGKKKGLDSPELYSRPETAATIRPETALRNFSDIPEQSSRPAAILSPTIETPKSPIAASESPLENLELHRPPPPTAKLPPTPPQAKRWAGNGRLPQPWNKLRKDPELWDPSGDTLVYFAAASKTPRPAPSFRVSSRVIEATESRFLITLLRQGLIDDSEAEIYDTINSIDDGDSQWPTSMASKSRAIAAETSRDRDLSGEVSYEIFFPAPPNKTKQETLRYQITTRNIFAMLYQASFVGLSLFQGLNDLLERLDMYMPAHTDNVGWIIDWLTAKGIDDVRNDPNSAAALLTWSESDSVRWHEGWIESFVHCAGMFSRVEDTPEFKSISTITRVLLERASLEIQVRVETVEERLQEFEFSDMWPRMSASPARESFDRLREFLTKYYTDFYGSWPPKPINDDIWLNRSLAHKLQTDFGALYDYFVDREVVWNASEESSSRKWTLVDSRRQAREVDSDGLPFTDILVAFDNRHRFPHIPHPYPLAPPSMSMPAQHRERSGSSAKKGKSSEEKMIGRKAALAYTEACNIYVLGSDFASNDLVDAFVRFERTDHAGEVDPFEARRGRWVLLYGILQVLATITVDTPGLRHTEDVAYYLNPRLRGTPPWKGTADHATEEASHEQSFCWQASKRWYPETSGVSALLRSPPHLSVMSSNASTAETVSSIRTPPIMDQRSYRLPVRSSGYGPGIKRLDDWRTSGELGSDSNASTSFFVKDFDEEPFP